jgi:glycine/D-amino acid oxidase-like deaminating enzyme
MTGTDTAAYGQSWYAATMVQAAPRPPLSSDLDVDVCVIGGGLAGLTVARELARNGWSVAVLEAGRLAAAASGRNTGFVLPGFAASPDKIIARVGFENTRRLWALSQAGLEHVRRIINEESACGIESEPGWLYVSKFDNGDDVQRVAELLDNLGSEVEFWPTERVRAVLRSERYFCAVRYLQAFAIHPLNYALTLAAAAERDGARIFEQTPALSIDPAGVRKRVVTPSARLRAGQIVIAGNLQLKALMPRLAATLVPITTYVITTAPLDDARLAAAIGYRGAVSDTDRADNHYRIVGGDRLMWSGRATVWPRNPRRYTRRLARDIRKTYPQLGKLRVDYAWAGTLGNTIHRMPQLGELGPGVWLAGGFGGHGLNTTAMAGTIIARAIIEGDDTWRQFTPFELVWAGGALGRAAVQVRVWSKRVSNGVAQHRARRRDPAAHAPETAPAAQEIEPQLRLPWQATAAEESDVPATSDDQIVATPASDAP